MLFNPEELEENENAYLQYSNGVLALRQTLTKEGGRFKMVHSTKHPGLVYRTKIKYILRWNKYLIDRSYPLSRFHQIINVLSILFLNINRECRGGFHCFSSELPEKKAVLWSLVCVQTTFMHCTEWLAHGMGKLGNCLSRGLLTMKLLHFSFSPP